MFVHVKTAFDVAPLWKIHKKNIKHGDKLASAALFGYLFVWEAVLYPGFQKWGSFGPLLSEFGGPSEIFGVQ